MALASRAECAWPCQKKKERNKKRKASKCLIMPLELISLSGSLRLSRDEDDKREKINLQPVAFEADLVDGKKGKEKRKSSVQRGL